MLDKTANANVYFNYKATQKEFHKEVNRKGLGEITAEEACETIRHSLVYCMRSGDRLVIWIGRLAPDFKKVYNVDGKWPSEQIFDFKFWRERENHMKLVLPDENHDLLNQPGKFVMNDEKF